MNNASQQNTQEQVSDTKKQIADEKARQKAREGISSFLDENKHIYQVTKDGKYWKFNADSQEWVPNTADALKSSDYRLRGQFAWEEFLQTMQVCKRIKDTKTYSFKDTPPSVLNMMMEQNRLKPSPIKTDASIFFDYLMESVSGGNADNALHLKQVIGWKYLHPETWQLPAIAFYGCGGAGKNLLFEVIAAEIFGSSNACRRSFKQVEKFSESIVGKTIVFFDERPGRDDESTMKYFIGQPTLSIEPKGSAVYDVENTALYVIATNGDQGPVRIEKNGTERRWSIIKTRDRLVDVIAKGEGCTEAEANVMIKMADQHVYRNKDEVAYFLHTCIEEAKKLESAPLALHSDDFDELIEIQRDVVDELIEEVFVDYAAFDYISLTTLYNMYLTKTRENNPSANPMSIQTFNAKINNYLDNNKTKIGAVVKRIKNRASIKSGSKFLNKTWVYYSTKNSQELGSYSDNSAKYFLGAYLSEKTPKDVEKMGNVVRMS